MLDVENVMIMKDARNGIYPVVVFIPKTGVTADDFVDTIYPFGWEEYTGKARLGRFMKIEEGDRNALLEEIFTLRYVLQRVTNTNDKTMGDVCWDNYLDDDEELPNYKFHICNGE